METDRKAVVLIHGIGDQEQTTTMREFLSTLTSLKISAPVSQRTLRLTENNGETSSYFIAETKINGKDCAIAEYYWSDLSQLKQGDLSFFQNFYQLATDAPYLIYSCLGPRVNNGTTTDNPVLRVLRAVVAFAMWLIYFPIIALNISFAVLVGGYAFHEKFINDQILPSSSANLTFIVSTIIAIGSILLMLRIQQRRYMRHLLMWMAFFLFMALAYFSWDLWIAKSQTSFQDSVTLFDRTIGILWMGVSIGTLIYLGSLPILMLFFRKRWRALLVGFAVNFLVIRFWMLLIMTVWLIFLVIVLDSGNYKNYVSIIGNSIRFYSLFWFDVAILGIALFAALAAYLWQTYKSRFEMTGRNYARLIVPTPVLLLTLVLFVSSLFLFQECAALESCTILNKSTNFIILNGAILLVFGSIASSYAAVAIDVTTDIVNYFKSDIGHRLANPFRAVWSVATMKLDSEASFRCKLHRRLNTLIDDLITNYGPFNKIVFVAHSLGSMILIDALKHMKAEGKTLPPFEIITLGSPYTYIFRYFFPHMFEPVGVNMIPNVCSWSNLYRENDYVGTVLSETENAGIEDIPQPPLGHLNYFSDQNVIHHVSRKICT